MTDAISYDEFAAMIKTMWTPTPDRRLVEVRCRDKATLVYRLNEIRIEKHNLQPWIDGGLGSIYGVPVVFDTDTPIGKLRLEWDDGETEHL